MTQAIDYSPLDLPQISQTMFYPQRVWSPTPIGASDHMIPVGPNVSVSARFYPRDLASPSILFFHGNGEVACQYDTPAPYYNRAGVNLFVADFRGYGLSDGSPTFSSMVADARAVFEYFRQLLSDGQFMGGMFVKGRSMGCHSAVEVAARYQEELRGLITESGSSAVERMVRRRGLDPESPSIAELLRRHREKLRSISLPLLVIHGERDELIPIEAAVELREAVSSQDVTFEVIPGAGHNDLFLRGRGQYFEAVRSFISDHGGDQG